MTTGMLWYDKDPTKKISEKILSAVNYYQQKYGIKPNICFIHPRLRDNNLAPEVNLEIQYNFSISPDHIWIGTHD